MKSPDSLRFMDESPTRRRKLALALYGVVGAPVVLTTYLLAPEGSARDIIRMSSGVFALAFLWLALRPQPTRLDWLYPYGVAPIVCCGCAYVAFGPANVGFIAAMGAAISVAAALFGASVAMVAMATATCTCFVIALRETGAWAALGNAGLVGVTMGVSAWITHVKSKHERALADALRASEQKLAKAFDNSRDAIFIFDLSSGRYIDVNESFERLTGYTRAEVVGKRASELQLWAAAEERQRMYEQLEAQGRVRDFHARFRDRNGREFWGEVSIDRIELEGRTCVLGATRDVSHRKQMDERNELLRVLFERGPVAQALISLDGRVLRANAAFAKLLGYSPSELAGESLHEAAHAQDRALVRRALCSLLEGCESVRFEARYLRRGGELVHADVSMATVSDDHGAPEYLMGTFVDNTERYRTHEAVLERENNFRTFFDSMDDLVVVARADGEIVCSNAALSRTLGFDAQSVPGRKLAELYASERRAQVDEYLAQATAGTPARWGARMIDARGEEVPVETRLWAGQWNGQSCVFGVSKDLRAEQDAQLRFEALFRNNPALMTVSDAADWRFVDANEAFLRRLGYNPNEVVGKTAEDLQLVPDRAQREAIERGLRERGRVTDLELQARRKDGSMLTALFSGELISSQGRQHLLTVMIDVSPRVDALRALGAKTALLEAQMAADIDGVLVIDEEHRRVLCNRKIAELFDVPAPIMATENSELFEHMLQKTKEPQQFLASGASDDSTYRDEIELKNGMVLDRYVAPVRGAAGERYGRIVTFRDITRQREAAASLLQLNAQLSAATEHARELAQQADQASAAKTEFLAVMSHEIRTPMNGIIGMTGLLLDTMLDAEQKRYAEAVFSSAESLLALTNAILDFSKIEAGKLSLEQLDFDLHAVFDDLCEILALRAGDDEPVEFVCAVAPHVPARLRGDASRLRQVLLNLLSNATKFTSRGQIVLGAELRSETAEQVQLRFFVRDTGIGIPADRLGILFQKFTQVDASTTRRYGGTGLGLAISKQLVELMGGEIGVTSEVGRGSEFWFTSRFDKQPSQAETPRRFAGRQVLVADDNPETCASLRRQLSAFWLMVEVATDGRAAQRCVRERAFDLVLMDLSLPGLDAEGLRNALYEEHGSSHPPLVVMARPRQRDPQRLRDAGFADLLNKPIARSALLAVLDKTLGGAATPAPGHSSPVAIRDVVREKYGIHVRILVVEDNITNQQVALGNLRKLGFRAEAVATGREALESLRTIPYDLVFMDVQMPDMDGLEATRAIRATETDVLNHEVPIVAMTAHAMRSDRDACLRAGMDDYLAKPFTPAALSEVLDRWLSRIGPTNVMMRMSVAGALPALEHVGLVGSTPFDERELLARVMDDRELAQAVLRGFLQDLPAQLLALHASLTSGDAAAVEKQAHKIKGAAAVVGGHGVERVALELERAGQVGDLGHARATEALLATEFELLRQRMETSQLLNVSRSTTA